MQKFRIIDLPEILDTRGTLGFAEVGQHVPFSIERIFYIYGVGQGKSRGAHAHHEGHQFLIALQGSFKVDIDDGSSLSSIFMSSSATGLYVPPMHWLDLSVYSSNALCLVLASNCYEEADYIRDYATFKTKAEGEKSERSIS